MVRSKETIDTPFLHVGRLRLLHPFQGSHLFKSA